MALKTMTGMWLNEDRSGEKYFGSGKSQEKKYLIIEEGAKFFLYKNNYKEEERQPGYLLKYDDELSQLLTEEEFAAQYGQEGTPKPSKPQADTVELDDDIPF